MACLFAARLSAAGVSVTLLGAWREALDVLRREGVCLVEGDACEQIYPVRATDDPRDCVGTQIALVLVKSWQTERAARQLAECLAPGGLTLTLQNGMGNREALANVLGDERVALGVTTLGANLMGPGRVRPAGDGTIHLEAHPRLEPLVDLLRSTGLAVEIVPDPEALLWGKLVINAAINPLTALLEVPNGELLERPSAHHLMTELACEAAAAAGALGIRLPYPDPAAAAEAVARRTAANRSSMLQDVQRGAPTEIDAICGAIVKAGEKVGVPVPVNRTFWQLINAQMEKKESANPR
jgi:2-dehydropantoate 2-reductase